MPRTGDRLRDQIVSGGGKAECIRLREILEGALRTFSPHIRAAALLDRDLATEAPPPGVVYLPVSMIENFLLDPDSIWESIQSVVEKTTFKSVEDVSTVLDGLLDGMMPLEVERRAIRALGKYVFQPKPPLEKIPRQVDEFTQELVASAAPEKIERLRQTAEEQVTGLKSSSQRREQFHGKDVLAAFLKAYLHSTGMAAGIFRYETARHARRRKKVVQFFDTFFTEALPEVRAPIVAGSEFVQISGA